MAEDELDKELEQKEKEADEQGDEEREELEERQAKEEKPHSLLKGALFLLISLGLVALVVYSPLFTLKHVRLTGAATLTEETVLEIAGLSIGERLFNLETGEVAMRLEKDLRIESASVQRSLPDTLEITITERVPVATIVAELGYVDLDRTGKVIAAYKTLKNVPIPLVTGISTQDLYIGDDAKDETVLLVLRFLSGVSQEAQSKISEINVGNPDAVTLYTTKAAQIRLGRMEERLEEKAALTEDFLLDQEESRYAVDYVDFSYKQPVIRLKGDVLTAAERQGKGI